MLGCGVNVDKFLTEPEGQTVTNGPPRARPAARPGTLALARPRRPAPPAPS